MNRLSVIACLMFAGACGVEEESAAQADPADLAVSEASLVNFGRRVRFQNEVTHMCIQANGTPAAWVTPCAATPEQQFDLIAQIETNGLQNNVFKHVTTGRVLRITNGRLNIGAQNVQFLAGPANDLRVAGGTCIGPGLGRIPCTGAANQRWHAIDP